MSNMEHNIVALVLIGYCATIGALGFLWERHKKYRAYYRRRNHPSMRNK